MPRPKNYKKNRNRKLPETTINNTNNNINDVQSTSSQTDLTYSKIRPLTDKEYYLQKHFKRIPVNLREPYFNFLVDMAEIGVFPRSNDESMSESDSSDDEDIKGESLGPLVTISDKGAESSASVQKEVELVDIEIEGEEMFRRRKPGRRRGRPIDPIIDTKAEFIEDIANKTNEGEGL